MIKKTIFCLILFKQIGFSLASIINIEVTSPTCKYVSKSFQRPSDTSDEAGTLRLNEINSLCEALEDFIPDDSLNLFLGRSVGWVAAAESFRLESDYSDHKGTWTTVHFSGGSALKDFEDEGFYTPEQLNSYKDYLRSIGVTPENILGAKEGLYLIDFILMGRTMHHFSKILVDWCHEESPNALPPKISFIDISFTTNYRSNFEHETVLSPPPTQFLLSNETMNPLIHAEGKDDIGKDNSLVCSFKPEQWMTWKSTLENYQPTPKALEMHEDLKDYLRLAKQSDSEALTKKGEEAPLESKYSLGMFIPQKLKSYFF
tara:strand:+ start:1873 stop:2820 length:948 start_codon:yes stop_codon:yes gene_type:complete